MSAVVVQGLTFIVVTTFYGVSGAEPMPTDYSKRMFNPERVIVTERDGDVSYVVGGHGFKKDGTPSLAGGKRDAYNTRHLSFEPEWLQTLIRDYCGQAGIDAES